MTEPTIQQFSAKKLIGVHIQTTLAANETGSLWYSFRSRQKEVSHQNGIALYSVQQYTDDFKMQNFTPQTTFEKWAAVEVTTVEQIPNGMEQLNIPTGLYAVFIHKGTVVDFPKTAQYIYSVWLPKSDYQLDNRPHFECMDSKYLGHMNPDSEEEVWIPIRFKDA